MIGWLRWLNPSGSWENSQTPKSFGLNLTSQLVIGYHWLAFPNQVRNRQSAQFTMNFEHKIYYISKIKIVVNLILHTFQNNAYFLVQKKLAIACFLRILSTKSIISQRLRYDQNKVSELCGTKTSPVLFNDMQIPPHEEPIFFGPKCCAIFWNEWKINFPIFCFWAMVVQKWISCL